MLRLLPLPVLLLTLSCVDYGYSSTPDEPEAPEQLDTSKEVVPECPTNAISPTVPIPTDPCEAEAEIGHFTPVVEWTWTENPIHPGYHQVMAAPAVGNLTDDNNDGKVDENDVPDVVFTAFKGGAYSAAGVIVAISGDDGRTLWSVSEAGGYSPRGTSGVALADFDGTGMSVLMSTGTGLLCLDASGAFKWHATVPAIAYMHPSVADIDHDGTAEIIFGRSVINADGTVRWSHGGTVTQEVGTSVAVDLDLDGDPEIITGSEVYNNDGTLRWSDDVRGWPAVADVDLDGWPDIVRVSSGKVMMHDRNGALVWQLALTDGGGGPPTIADFDGDGEPEIGVASRQYYRVIESDGTVLWENVVQDYSSSKTGSSVFDFEGDGAAEVVYADEEVLRIYDGSTGAVELSWASHASGTLYEYPLVVDVDNDGSAEIIVASNNYNRPGSNGISSIGDQANSWSPARPIWNQHQYHITNVNDDGTIPRHEAQHITLGNSYRAGNSNSRSGLALSDLRIGAVHVCTITCDWNDTVTLSVPVSNRGSVDADDVVVGWSAIVGSSRTRVGSSTIGTVPALTEVVALIDVPAADFGSAGLEVAVDPDDFIEECVTTDAPARLLPNPCDTP